MSLPSNPYQAPGATDDEIRFVEVEADRIGERTVEALATTQTWVRLIGWSAVLLGGWHGLRTISFLRLIPQEGWGMLGGAAIVLFNATLFGAGGVLLLRYASRISDFVISRRVEHLDGALEAQRSFWRFFGAAFALLLIIFCAGILFAFFGVGASAFWKAMFG